MSKRKAKAQQLECDWGQPEAFKLTIQHGTDGDRIAKEKAEHEANQARNEEAQIDWEDAAKQYQAV